MKALGPTIVESNKDYQLARTLNRLKELVNLEEKGVRARACGYYAVWKLQHPEETENMKNLIGWLNYKKFGLSIHMVPDIILHHSAYCRLCIKWLASRSSPKKGPVA